jgi:AP-1 complex subunit gamma-1
MIVSERKPVGSTRTDKDSIVDLIGDNDTTVTPPSNGASSGPSTHDLLADIFGTSSSEPASTSAPVPQRSAANDIMSLFDSSPAPSSAPPPAAPSASSGSLFDMVSPSATSPPPQAPPPKAAPAPQQQQLQSYPAYEKNGLKITLTPKTSPAQAGVVQILARFTATQSVENVNFQVAVPKVSLPWPRLRITADSQTQQLQMQAMSNTTVNAGSTETQQMRVLAPAGVSCISQLFLAKADRQSQVRLRMRITYTVGGQNVQDQQDFAGFPADLTSR